MQVEVVRHDGRADDAQRQHDRVLAVMARVARHQARGHRVPVGRHHRHLRHEAERHGADQAQLDRLDLPEALALQAQHDHRCRARSARCPRPAARPSSSLKASGAAQHLGDVAGNDRDLGGDPLQPLAERAVALVAGLREVAPGHQAEPRGQHLQEDRRSSRRPPPTAANSRTRSRPGCRSPSCPGPCSRSPPAAGAGEAAQLLGPRRAGIDGDAALHFGGTERGGRNGRQRHRGRAREKGGGTAEPVHCTEAGKIRPGSCAANHAALFSSPPGAARSEPGPSSRATDATSRPGRRVGPPPRRANPCQRAKPPPQRANPLPGRQAAAAMRTCRPGVAARMTAPAVPHATRTRAGRAGPAGSPPSLKPAAAAWCSECPRRRPPPRRYRAGSPRAPGTGPSARRACCGPPSHRRTRGRSRRDCRHRS